MKVKDLIAELVRFDADDEVGIEALVEKEIESGVTDDVRETFPIDEVSRGYGGDRLRVLIKA